MASERNAIVSLDTEIEFVPESISDVLNQVSSMHNFSKQLCKLDFHIRLLEEELSKVYAFKRQLPYCMQLLEDAIEILKKKSLHLREEEEGGMESSDGRNRGVEASKSTGDKKTWMSRVRLWTIPVQLHDGEDDGFSFKSRPQGMTKTTAFKEKKRGVAVEEESLSIPVEAVDLSGKHEKKQRRCWSPQLHKLFVDAISRLGGPYVATPRQIRDLMKVDVLTNDEVKSHLQKYRFHVKKVAASSAGITADASLCCENDVAPEADKSVSHV